MKLIKNLSAVEFFMNLILPVLLILSAIFMMPVVLITPNIINDFKKATGSRNPSSVSIGLIVFVIFILAVVTFIPPLIMKLTVFKKNIAYFIFSGVHLIIYLVAIVYLIAFNYSKVENGSLNSFFNLIIFFLVLIFGCNIPTKVMLAQKTIKDEREKRLKEEKEKQLDWYNHQQESFENQVASIRSHVRCRYCDSVVPYNNGICSHCGAKLVI